MARRNRGSVEVDTDRLSDYQLISDVGNPYEPEGLTRALLSGTGRLVVEQHQAGPTRPTEGPEQVAGGYERGRQGEGRPPDVTARRAGEYDFGVEATKEMITRAADFPWAQPFPTRPGIPSEPVLEWTLQDERGPKLTLTVWLRDAEKDEVMGPVVAAFRHAVERATRGELFL
jgi:hypothetical protein